MKKEYISPAVEIVACMPNSMLALSMGGGTVGEGNGDYEEAVNEFRGDWSNIWEGM